MDPLNEAITGLQEKGYRVTPQRRQILRCLAEAQGPVPAHEVHRKICLVYPDIGLDTVYRNLRLLAELGAVHHIALSGRRADLFELEGTHHHHLICVSCGTIEHLPECPGDEEALRHAAERGFKAMRHNFEIYGLCARCAAAEAEARAPVKTHAPVETRAPVESSVTPKRGALSEERASSQQDEEPAAG